MPDDYNQEAPVNVWDPQAIQNLYHVMEHVAVPHTSRLSA
jgi:hypothetical protein